MLERKIKNLQTKLSKTEDLSDFVEDVTDILRECADYVALVSGEEVSIQMARLRLDGLDFRAYVQGLDRNRRIMHNGLMVNVNLLNRLCAMVGVEAVADVNPDDRESYYTFAKLVVDDYFQTAIRA